MARIGIQYAVTRSSYGHFICYTILALLFLLLATGKFKPKTWQELPQQKVKLIRFGCFFFFAVITLNLLARLFTR